MLGLRFRVWCLGWKAEKSKSASMNSGVPMRQALSKSALNPPSQLALLLEAAARAQLIDFVCVHNSEVSSIMNFSRAGLRVIPLLSALQGDKERTRDSRTRVARIWTT